MAYKLVDPRPGYQALDVTSTTKQHELGTCVIGVDDAGVQGQAEFIYLAGLASTAVGELVIFDQYAGTTTRAITTSRGPAAIAMSANVGSQYGWYQLKGSAVVKSGTVAADTVMYATATAGTVDDAVVSGALVSGATFKTADGTPESGFAIAQINNPSLSGAA